MEKVPLILLLLLAVAPCSSTDFVTIDHQGLDIIKLTHGQDVYNFQSRKPRKEGSCRFVGTDSTKPDNWISISDCKEELDAVVMLNGLLYTMLFTDNSKTEAKLLKTETVLAGQNRNQAINGYEQGSAAVGDYVVVPDSIIGKHTRARDKFKSTDFDSHSHLKKGSKPKNEQQGSNEKEKQNKSRHKRALPEKYLQLALFIDSGLWGTFFKRYGPNTATVQEKLNDYVDAVVDQMQLIYLLPSLDTKVHFKVVHRKIWETQPAAVPASDGVDGLQTLYNFCVHANVPANGWDHAALLTGYDIKWDATGELAGIAYLGTVCGAYSCSVAESRYGLTNTAIRVAHEIGHSLGMLHDGEPSDSRSASCSSTCCMMSTIPLKLIWSTCSNTVFHDTLDNFGSPNCLENVITEEPLNHQIGQDYPNEAQCHEGAGDCFTFLQGSEGSCDSLQCKRSLLTFPNPTPRADGSYCGPGRVCQAGTCTATGEPLIPVDGGWGDWNPHPTGLYCGGDCTECLVVGQLRMKTNVRRCDSPHPNNGGAACSGLAIRGRDCYGTVCTTGATSLAAYAAFVCHNWQAFSYYQILTCAIRCINRSFTALTYFEVPNGVSCNSGNGRCVQAVCLQQQCSDSNFWVNDNMTDCDLLTGTPSCPTITGMQSFSISCPPGHQVASIINGDMSSCNYVCEPFEPQSCVKECYWGRRDCHTEQHPSYPTVWLHINYTRPHIKPGHIYWEGSSLVYINKIERDIESNLEQKYCCVSKQYNASNCVKVYYSETTPPAIAGQPYTYDKNNSPWTVALTGKPNAGVRSITQLQSTGVGWNYVIEVCDGVQVDTC